MIPFVDLKAQYREHQARDRSPPSQRVLESAQFVLGAEVAAFEQEFAAYCSADARHRRQHRHERAAPGAARRRRRPGRRGHHRPVHVRRHRRGDRLHRRDAGVRRHRPGDVHDGPGADRSGDHAAHQGDPPGAPLRPAGRHGSDPRDRAPARPGRHRGRLPGARRRVQGPPRRQPRRHRAASASIRARTSAPTAKAAWSSPTTTTYAKTIRMLRDWGAGAAATTTCSRASTTGWRASRARSCASSCATSRRGPRRAARTRAALRPRCWPTAAS